MSPPQVLGLDCVGGQRRVDVAGGGEAGVLQPCGAGGRGQPRLCHASGGLAALAVLSEKGEHVRIPGTGTFTAAFHQDWDF